MMTTEIPISTAKNRELVNITDEVERVVEESDVDEGQCLIFAPHATAAILLNEDEPGFKADIETLIDKWIPKGDWQHNLIDKNEPPQKLPSEEEERAAHAKDQENLLELIKEIFAQQSPGTTFSIAI